MVLPSRRLYYGNIVQGERGCIKIIFLWHCDRRGCIKNYHFNVAVEGVSKLSFQCGSRDAKFCVSTIWLDKLLILNVLYVVALVETWRAASLQHQCRNFDAPICNRGGNVTVFNCAFFPASQRHQHSNMRLRASMQAPTMPAFSFSFDDMITESLLTRLSEYLRIADLMGSVR